MAIRSFKPFEHAIKKIWQRYCKSKGTGLELKLVPMELESLYEEVIERKGLKKGVWDIALLNTDWIAEAYSSQAVADLSSFIEEHSPDTYPDGWPESLLRMQKFGDHIAGLPFHDGPECLIYRKDLFERSVEREKFREKTGKELKPPETWEDFVEIAQFFQRPDDNLYGSVWAAYPDGHNTVFDFCLQLWTRGGTLTGGNDEIVLNTSAAREGLAFYRDILQNGKVVHPDCGKFDSVASGMAFLRGEAAMMINWFGFASLCEVHDESKTKGKVNIVSIPRGIKGEKVSLNVYWLYAVGSGSAYQKVAYDFIRYAINKSNDKLLTMEGGIGCRISTWRDPEVNKKVPYYHRLEKLHRNARTLPRRADWAKIADIIDQLVLKTINTDTAIPEILTNAQESIDNLSANPQS